MTIVHGRYLNEQQDGRTSLTDAAPAFTTVIHKINIDPCNRLNLIRYPIVSSISLPSLG
jgi:hypothetical protein